MQLREQGSRRQAPLAPFGIPPPNTRIVERLGRVRGAPHDREVAQVDVLYALPPQHRSLQDPERERQLGLREWRPLGEMPFLRFGERVDDAKPNSLQIRHLPIETIRTTPSRRIDLADPRLPSDALVALGDWDHANMHDPQVEVRMGNVAYLTPCWLIVQTYLASLSIVANHLLDPPPHGDVLAPFLRRPPRWIDRETIEIHPIPALQDEGSALCLAILHAHEDLRELWRDVIRAAAGATARQAGAAGAKGAPLVADFPSGIEEVRVRAHSAVVQSRRKGAGFKDTKRVYEIVEDRRPAAFKRLRIVREFAPSGRPSDSDRTLPENTQPQRRIDDKTTFSPTKRPGNSSMKFGSRAKPIDSLLPNYADVVFEAHALNEFDRAAAGPERQVEIVDTVSANKPSSDGEVPQAVARSYTPPARNSPPQKPIGTDVLFRAPPEDIATPTEPLAGSSRSSALHLFMTALYELQGHAGAHPFIGDLGGSRDDPTASLIAMQPSWGRFARGRASEPARLAGVARFRRDGRCAYAIDLDRRTKREQFSTGIVAHVTGKPLTLGDLSCILRHVCLQQSGSLEPLPDERDERIGPWPSGDRYADVLSVRFKHTQARWHDPQKYGRDLKQWAFGLLTSQ